MFNRFNKQNITNTTNTINSDKLYNNDKIKKRVITMFGTKYEIKHHSSSVINSKFFTYVGLFVSIFKKQDIMEKLVIILTILCMFGFVCFLASTLIEQRIINTCIDDGLKCDYLETICKPKYSKYLENINIRHINSSPFVLSKKVRSCIYDNYYNEINTDMYNVLQNILISCIKWFGYIVAFEITILTTCSVVRHLINFSIIKYNEFVPDVNNIV